MSRVLCAPLFSVGVPAPKRVRDNPTEAPPRMAASSAGSWRVGGSTSSAKLSFFDGDKRVSAGSGRETSARIPCPTTRGAFPGFASRRCPARRSSASERPSNEWIRRVLDPWDSTEPGAFVSPAPARPGQLRRLGAGRPSGRDTASWGLISQKAVSGAAETGHINESATTHSCGKRIPDASRLLTNPGRSGNRLNYVRPQGHRWATFGGLGRLARVDQ